MRNPITSWHQEHVNFGHLIDLLERQLDLFHTGEAPNYELMLDVMYYMTHYPDVFHHPREDLAFARLRDRDQAMAELVAELTRQHVELRHHGESLVAMLDDIVNGAIRSRDELESVARRYVAGFRGHIRLEESQVLPQAAKILGEGDWAAIDANLAAGDDPLFGSSVVKRYAGLAEQIRREARIR